MKHLHDIADAILSYFAAFISMAMNIPWMAIGGAILLVCRLIVDIPPAYNKLKEMLKTK